MRKSIWLSLVVGILALGGGGWWLWQQHDASAHKTAYVLDTSTQGSTGTGASSSSNLSGALQEQVVGQASNGTANTQQNSTDTAKNAKSEVTLNPAEFKLYEKYKDSKDALFVDMTVGTGPEATAGKKLSVNYRGWLTNGSIFDQNVDSNKPFQFTMGAHGVITGWEQGLYGMKAGGERLLIIPPAAGYGNIAQGPIPANSVLIFDVKLLSVD